MAAALASVAPADLEGFDDFARVVRRAHPEVAVVSRRWIAREARSVELLARYFESVLQRTHARIVFCSVYYTLTGMAFCLAARRRGIPSVDVQHGVTAGNPAYDGWSRFPEGAFALLPALFWCWSASDARPVCAWPAAGRRHHGVVIGGHPWLALWRTARPLATALRRQPSPPRSRSLTILVTLTWSSGLSEELKRLLAGSPLEWTWWIRLHPLMGRDRAPIRSWCERNLPGRAHVDAPTDLPLPLLLDAADVHLTHNSTVVQEAARLGTPSVVIDRHALDMYPEELRSGWAVLATEPAETVEALISQCQRRRLLDPIPPYPSWTDMSSVVRALLAESAPCLATAPAASSPTPARA